MFGRAQRTVISHLPEFAALRAGARPPTPRAHRCLERIKTAVEKSPETSSGRCLGSILVIGIVMSRDKIAAPIVGCFEVQRIGDFVDRLRPGVEEGVIAQTGCAGDWE
jgi:hypothetical protein